MSYIDCFLVSNRMNEFFYSQEVNDKKVGAYLKMMKQKKKKLGDLIYELPSIAKENKIFEEIKRVIDEEIKCCEYYFEYNKKQRKCPYFNKWVFYKPEDRPDITDSWVRENVINQKKNAWIVTNGRVMAVIEIIDKISSIKVMLTIKNDSETFYFADRYKEITYKNLRKKESVDAFIEKLKNHVIQEIFPSNRYLLASRREYYNVETMLKLLHINVSIEDIGSIKEYCPKCGRKLVDNHCPVHLEVEPVDENDPIVKKFKELEKTNRGD